MSGRDGDSGRWLADALATRDIEKLKPSMEAAGERVNNARRHVRSARALADDDPTLALAACHDAIRKAVTGHMRAAGYRPRSGEGAHRIVLDYARQQLAGTIDDDDLDDADPWEPSRPVYRGSLHPEDPCSVSSSFALRAQSVPGDRTTQVSSPASTRPSSRPSTGREM